jgi:hypothetical protein
MHASLPDVIRFQTGKTDKPRVAIAVPIKAPVLESINLSHSRHERDHFRLYSTKKREAVRSGIDLSIY